MLEKTKTILEELAAYPCLDDKLLSLLEYDFALDDWQELSLEDKKNFIREHQETWPGSPEYYTTSEMKEIFRGNKMPDCWLNHWRET